MSARTAVFIVDTSQELWADRAALSEALNAVAAARSLFLLADRSRVAAVVGVAGGNVEYLSGRVGEGEDPWDGGGGLHLSRALSKALCFAHKHAHPGDAPPLIVMMLGSKVLGSDHTAMMNAAFAAAASAASFHLLWIGGGDADPAAKQAAAATSGALLVPPEKPSSLFPLLVQGFVAPAHVPGALQHPRSTVFDARAMCQSTQQLVHVGRVCSVCFGVFHTSVDTSAGCPTCQTPTTGHS